METTYTPPTFEAWHAIADAITASGIGKATLEGGGAACTFIGVQMQDGRYIAFGDVNETWTADVYDILSDLEDGTGPDTSLDLHIPTADHTADKLANALKVAMEGGEEWLGSIDYEGIEGATN